MIDFNLSEKTLQFIGGYKSNTGPLPTLMYPLLGLWRDPQTDEVIKALFQADRIPTHENEPILHRYEGVSHQSHARYRYFVVPGHAGLVLAPQHMGSGIMRVSHHLVRTTTTDLTTPENEVEIDQVEIPDLLGNFGPIVLCIKRLALETPAT